MIYNPTYDSVTHGLQYARMLYDMQTGPLTSAVGASRNPERINRGNDRVELSDTALELSRLLPPVQPIDKSNGTHNNRPQKTIDILI